MEKIIEPVDRQLLLSELTADRFLRRTNKGDNEIYITDFRTAPNVMREIGRLREIAFREAGGGTGQAMDIDEFDTMDVPCRQLIVWNPETSEIIGGYRFLLGEDMELIDGVPRIATSHMFGFAPAFLRDYLPSTLELGRSFVTLEYQSTKSQPKSLYALDNLWDGLGALTVVYPQIKYLFGKVTMYPRFDTECRDLILHFLHKHFPDTDGLVWPLHPLAAQTPAEELERLLPYDSFRDDYRALNHEVRARGCSIPPLVNAYMGLSPTMRMFGTALNPEFGNVMESGIFFKISEIFEEKKKRHIGTYNGHRYTE